MSAVPKVRLTSAEYLTRERAASFRSEFFRGEMFAMAGASFEHTLIKDNLSWALRNALRETSCTTMTADLRVKVSATGLYTYPDVIVLCGPPELEDQHGDTLLNPQVIFEILSDSTEKYDRGKKFGHYRTIATLREYVLVSQDSPLCERFIRESDGSWNLREFRGLEIEFALATVAARIKMADVYQGVTFPPEPTTET